MNVDSAGITTETGQENSSENQKDCFYQVEDNTLRIYIKHAENNDTLGNNAAQTCTSSTSLFVLDYSSSMYHDWKQIQNAVQYFMENSTDSSASNSTHFIVYNDAAKESSISEILSMSAGGCTSFGSAFAEIKSFITHKTKANELINVIFMTDGQDNGTRDIPSAIAQLKTFISTSARFVAIHTIGFGSDHDRDFLSKVNEIGNFGTGIYRYAECQNDQLTTKFEEMFDFLAVSQHIVLQLSEITSFQINTMSTNEIDYVAKISHIDDSDKTLLKQIHSNASILINNDIACKYKECDGFFYVKRVENMDISTENELEKAQEIMNSIKVHKVAKELRSTLLMSKMIVQSKLDKYYQVFANVSRGLISGDHIVAELNSLRHETTFSRARQQRAMNKRVTKNSKTLQKMQQELNALSKPDLSIFSDEDKELKCLLSGDSIIDIMTESNNNILVFTLNVARPEHTIDSPTNIFVNKYLVGTYSMEAIQNATRFAINEKGSSNALGGFIQSKKFKYRHNGKQCDVKQNDDDEKEGEHGLFRGCDGEYSNSYLPLFINEEHWKRVEIQIRPILGYFFTLDPLGFEPNQYIALLTVLGHMLCCEANDYNHKLYKSKWFRWLMNDYTKLCKAVLPKISDYLLNENGFGGIIESGDLLKEFVLSPKFRSKQVIQNLLVIIGLMHCKNMKTKEVEIKFIEELWRRNFGVHFKSAPRSQVEELLEKLVFDRSNEDDSKTNENDNQHTFALKKEEELKYAKYAKIRLGIIKNKMIDIVIDNDDEQNVNATMKEYEPYKIINYEENKEKLDKIISMILNKITKRNEFVSGYFDNKAYKGIGIDGKIRWLMVLQALRFSSNSLMNSATNNDEYICAYDVLCDDKKEKISIEQCLKSYIETKEKYRREHYDALITNQKYLYIAKNIVLSEDIFSFCGKIMSKCATRGGKIFDNVCSLLFDSKVNDEWIPLYDDKLMIIMNGKYDNKYKIISAGLPWIRCPLNNVIRFKAVVGDKKWKTIEESMHGTYGYRYRESDLPNRHGHCNSNPNPRLVQYFGGFSV